jgi:hypothetical protein
MRCMALAMVLTAMTIAAARAEDSPRRFRCEDETRFALSFLAPGTARLQLPGGGEQILTAVPMASGIRYEGAASIYVEHQGVSALIHKALDGTLRETACEPVPPG